MGRGSKSAACPQHTFLKIMVSAAVDVRMKFTGPLLVPILRLFALYLIAFKCRHNTSLNDYDDPIRWTRRVKLIIIKPGTTQPLGYQGL